MRSIAVTLACFTLAAVPSTMLAQQRKCGDAQNPETLPAPSALIDSARAMAELEPLGVPREGIVFSLLFNETDSFPTVRLLEVADAEALAVFAGTVRPQKPAGAGAWAVRVRVRGGTTPGLTLERSVYCAPVPTPQLVARPPMRVEVRVADVMPSMNRPTRITVEVMVAATGEVLSVRLLESTGLRDVDDEITRSWQARSFLPALIDGRPISALYRTDGRAPKL
jgi:hypothetical protein